MSLRTKVKICGITNAADAAAACDFGADALGFIFVPGSPRFVGDNATRLLAGVPPFVWRVGVFDTVCDGFVPPIGLDAVQYYNEGEPARKRAADGLLRRPQFVRAFRVRDEASLREVEAYPHDDGLVLLDAYSDRALGGTGHRFNWNLATQVMETGRRIILAGGLTANNVGEAVRAVRPYMVDVSSGVEAEPGRKDFDRVRRFIAAVRDADREIAGS